MNWFKLLKVQTQTQRQGFRLDDKDEDYVLEEDDDCFEKLKKYIGSFFEGKPPTITDYYGKLPLDVNWKDDTGEATISRGYTKPLPDEYFCRAKKWIEEKLADHDKNVSYEHHDEELIYTFNTAYKPSGYRFQAAILTNNGTYQQIRRGRAYPFRKYICVIQKVVEGGESS